MIAPNRAAQNPETVNPGVIQAVNARSPALITKWKSPRVRIVIGSESKDPPG